MNLILLSGGSGKRLWPISNDVRSKQFIKIFQTQNGYESMAQRIYRQIKNADPNAKITIATSKSQVSTLKNQLASDVGISVEPERRDTFPAIALACAWLRYKEKIAEEEPVVVCPVDPYVDEKYFFELKNLSDLAKVSDSNLVLMGIEATHPSEKYGYILPKEKKSVSQVESFKEKPDEKTAQKYIEQGALWNGGVFAFKLGYILQKTREFVQFSDFDDLRSKYSELPKISFDYAIVEKEKSIQVLRFAGIWKDLGTWNTLTEAMKNPTIGNATLCEDCQNVHVVNELDLPILCMGIKNAVIAASAQGILVSDKEKSSRLKNYVEKFKNQIMFAEKSWGKYDVLDVQDSGMTVRVTLNAGQRMNYHSHEHRNEIWTILSGQGEVIVDGMHQSVGPSDVVTIQAGCRHTIIAHSELKIIEIQLGKEITKEDKKKFVLEEQF